MPFQKKEIPEWLKTGSNTDPSSNFTVPKAVPVTGSKSSAKGRRKSTIKKDPQSSDFDLKKDKNGLVIHVWDKVVKFEKQPVEPNGPSADQDPLQPRTIILKPTPRSLLADVMHIARSVPEGLSQEEVLHVESDLLSSLTPPKIKCMKNSSELEAEEAERREMKELMLSMDEVNSHTRPKRRFFET
ncbi:hypothetical protein L0F63_006565, partial [Massospora cicadina]